MKIDDIKLGVPPPTYQGTTAQPGNNTDFKSIFNNQMAQVDGAQELIDMATVDNRVALLEHGDTLLSFLDAFAADLENPDKRLKQITPLVNNIENEVSKIQATVAENTSVDNDLQNLMKELTVTASVAMCKFQRGDFI